MDGDADRLVYYDSQCNIIDGDKIISLLVISLHKILYEVLGLDEVDLCVITTHYSNSSLDDFLKKFNINNIKTKTGVKYMHEEALSHDISLSYEANGHGNL